MKFYPRGHIKRFWYLLTGLLKFYEKLIMGLEFTKEWNEFIIVRLQWGGGPRAMIGMRHTGIRFRPCDKSES